MTDAADDSQRDGAIRWDLGNRGAIFKGSLTTPKRSPVPNWLLHFQHGDEL